MPKQASPIPPIVSLVALHNLYREDRGIPKWPDKISEVDYIKKISEALITDKVFAEKNENFINLFRGKPYESNWKRAPGIMPERLDKIALTVIDRYDMREKFNLPKVIEYPWDVFSRIIFPTPDYIEPLNQKKYYKYLDMEEKRIIDNYLVRRYNELGIIKNSIINYALYLWSSDYRDTRVAILTIDPIQKFATYSYFAPTQGGWSPKSVMRSYSYIHGGATLFIDCQEEDPAKPFIRANILLSLLDVQLTNLPIIKGTLTVSGHNATTPVCCEIVLEKCDSYFDAYQKVIDPKQKNPLLCLEVQNTRIEVANANIFAIDRLRSYPLFKLLEEIYGYYLILYVTLDGARNGPGKLQKGLCYIDLDGKVSFKFPTVKDIIDGYIDQQVYRGNNFLAINYFISQSGPPLDVQYKFEIERNHSKDGRVEYLNGCYNSIALNTIYKGDIIFLKLDGNGLKLEKDKNKKPLRYSSFEKALEDNPIDDSIDITKVKPTGLDLVGYNILKERRYDH